MTTLETLKEENKILRGVKLPLYMSKDDEDCIIMTMLHARELVYNWATDKLWKNYNSYTDHMEDYKTLSYAKMSNMFTEYKNSDECDELIAELHTGTARVAIREAINNFRMLKNQIAKGAKKPRYHGKDRHATSFGIRSERSYILDGCLYTESIGDLPRLCIPLLTHKFDGIGGNGTVLKSKLTVCWYNPRIVKETIGWYLCFTIPRDRKSLEDRPWTEPIGIDLGCKTTFQLSTEEFFNQPDVSRLRKNISDRNKEITRLYKLRKKRAHKQGLHVWELSKSKNELKLIERRNKAYKKIHNKLENFYYRIINDIVKRRPEAIVLETIYVKDIRRNATNPNASKEIAQVYFCMIRYMFESKCDEYSIPLYEVNEHYPSSLICNQCKYKHNNLGKTRIFICPNCGYTIDRDLNASLNLRDVYVNRDAVNIKWWNGHGDKLILKDKTTSR